FTVSFSDAIPIINGHTASLWDLLTLGDSEENPASFSGARPTWLKANAGAAPQNGQLTPALANSGYDAAYPPINNPNQPVSGALWNGVLNWVLTQYNRADYTSILTAFKQELKDDESLRRANVVAPLVYTKPDFKGQYCNNDGRYLDFNSTFMPEDNP